MAHELLLYGIPAILILTVIFLGIWFIAAPIVRTYLEKNSLIYLLGLISAVIFGYFFGNGLSLVICLGVPFNFMCEWGMIFVTIVGCCVGYWAITKPKTKEC